MSFPESLGGSENGQLSGVVVAVVTDNTDDEELGRVRVRFPWRPGDDESYWAPIAVPMAGEDMGTYFLPEEGDEVLVAFEYGDINYPHVLGALWGGKKKPPEDNADGKNNTRMIRSRSGHEVVLNDSESEGAVEITTNGGHEIVLDDTTGGEKITIEDSSGQNTLMFDSAQGSVELEGGSTLRITAPNINIKGEGNVGIEASGVLTLKGSLIKIN